MYKLYKTVAVASDKAAADNDPRSFRETTFLERVELAKAYMKATDQRCPYYDDWHFVDTGRKVNIAFDRMAVMEVWFA